MCRSLFHDICKHYSSSSLHKSYILRRGLYSVSVFPLCCNNRSFQIDISHCGKKKLNNRTAIHILISSMLFEVRQQNNLFAFIFLPDQDLFTSSCSRETSSVFQISSRELWTEESSEWLKCVCKGQACRGVWRYSTSYKALLVMRGRCDYWRPLISTIF